MSITISLLWCLIFTKSGATSYVQEIQIIEAINKAGAYNESMSLIDSLYPLIPKDSLEAKIKLSKIQIDNTSQVENYKQAYLWYHELKELSELESQLLLKKDHKRIEVQEKHEAKALKDSIRHSYRKEMSELFLSKVKLQNMKTKRQLYLMIFIILLVVIGLLILIVLRVRLKRISIQIANQKEKIDTQTELSQKQKSVLAYQNNEIRESLRFAEKIQNSILPSSKDLIENLGNHFVFFKPKDEVSGDFYWMKTKEEKVYFAVADSTGHGVPGAMVSFVNHNQLNESLQSLNQATPERILDETKQRVTNAFKDYRRQLKDGMDIILCSYDKTNKELEFSLANNPLYLVRNGELSIIKGDRQPVGFTDETLPFTKHKMQIEKGDIIYMCSDGFQDQFGGENDKKYKVGRFKKYLLKIHSLEMKDQKLLLEQEFSQWKNNTEQTDDVLVLGVKF